MSRGEPLILLLKVLRHLQACHSASLGATLEELAEACEVSTRTIRRKLRALEEAGIPIDETTDMDRRKRYSINHKLVPSTHVSFEPFEAAALFVAEGMMAAMGGLPLAREAQAALDKATQGVPAAFRQELEQLLGALHGSIQGRHAYAPFGTRFINLVDAVSERWPVEIVYRSLGRDEAKTHLVHPYMLHCQTGTVYLVARKPDNPKTLTFTLDRIEEVKVRDDELFDRDLGFDPAKFVAESFGGYHEGEVVEVKVRFEAAVAKVIREREWHASQQITDLDDDAIDVTFQTAGPTGVMHWTHSFLPFARVISPDWLVERQLEDAKDWLKHLETAP
jgi:predicted DNA-binding transcriptional regulator YafY